MNSPVVYNLVAFVAANGTDASAVLSSPAFIELDGPFKLSAGLRPDVNAATIPYAEFQKLGSNWIGGSVQFYYKTNPNAGSSSGSSSGSGSGGSGGASGSSGGSPDVTIAGCSIVDCVPGKMGMIVGKGWVPETYKIYIADWRQRLVAPRGGRLKLGLINDGDTPPGSASGQPAYDAATGEPAAAAGTISLEMTLTQLIQACMAAMGLSTAVPNVDAIPAPRKLQWHGSHAPTELEKLLPLAGLQFAPDLNGSGSLVKLATGPAPTFSGDDALPVASYAKSDSRGTTVVIASYPTRSVTTQSMNGPSPSTWYFVGIETDGSWKPLDSVSYLNGSAANTVKSKFASVPPQYFDLAQATVYRFIQIAGGGGSGLPPYAMSPVLRRRFEADLNDYPLLVTAPIAVFDKTGFWAIGDRPTTITPEFLHDASVLRLSQPLLQVTQPTLDPYTDFQQLTSGLIVRFSTEDATKLGEQSDANGNQAWQPAYFEAGFQRNADGSIKVLNASDTANALSGTDAKTVVICRPELQLLTVDGKVINQTDLQTRAQAIAAQYLADASQPTQIASARGFQSTAPSAAVSRVEWDQRELITRAFVNDWFSPTGSTMTPADLQRLEDAAAHPGQPKTQGRRADLGTSGSTQKSASLQPLAAPKLPGGGQWVRLTVVSGQSAAAYGTNVPPSSPSLIYNASSLQGNLIASNVGIAWQRQLGHVTPAQNGYLDHDVNGDPVITLHDEVIDGGAC
jgi:hypothetical protein